MTTATTDDSVDERKIGGLTIAYDERVLAPRPWTAVQGAWAGRLASSAPPGPILEVCCGVGHIGLVAASRSDRLLVQADADPVACRLALRNAAAAGLADRTCVVEAGVDDVRTWTARYPIIIADPPYLLSSDVADDHADPAHAVDGGDDGLDVARRCIDLIVERLSPGGSALVQLGAADQVAALVDHAGGRLDLGGHLTVAPDRHVALYRLG